MTNKRTRNDHDGIKAKRACLLDMRSVPASPTDRINLELFQNAQLDLAQADEQLTKLQWRQHYLDEVRSEGQSSIGEDEIAELANWDGPDCDWKYDSEDEVEHDQQDTPGTQYDDKDDKVGSLMQHKDEAVLIDHDIHVHEEHRFVEGDTARYQERNPQELPLHDWDTAEALCPDLFATQGRGGRWSLAIMKEMSQLYR